jgi:hypothetical protein
LVVGGAADDRVDLFTRVHVVVAGIAHGVALDGVDRIRRDELAALGVAEDRAEHHERLARGAGALVAGVPALDLLAGDRAYRSLAERGKAVVAHQVAVVLER